MARVPKVAAVVSVATRLKRFGLAAAKLPLDNDLEVPASQTVVLDPANKKFAGQVSQITPKTIDDLKAWIGVPDAAFTEPAVPAVSPATILPVHDAYTPEQSTTMYAIARAYIFGHSGAVSQKQTPALNAWLQSIAGSINIIVFRDIHVAAGATLVVSPSITVLFARYITIDRNGVIQIKCTFGGINCAGIRGAEPLLVPLPVPVYAVNQ